jgi:hypothetical protein
LAVVKAEFSRIAAYRMLPARTFIPDCLSVYGGWFFGQSDEISAAGACIIVI